MIGIYDYTVILTYLSLLSGMMGIIVSAQGHGHPYMASFFLLFCGLCDTFDGVVARTKPGRTEQEKAFGVQIDSLSDLVAFGILPGAIAVCLYTSDGRPLSPRSPEGEFQLYPCVFVLAVLFYVLAALIRLAWFNVLELEHMDVDAEGRKQFTGLPVTSSALVFPLLLLLNYLTVRDFTLLYFLALPLMSFLFLGSFHIRKPGRREIALMLLIGAVEFVLMLFLRHPH